MYVNKIIQSKNGAFKFKGEVTQDELDYIINVGLNTLLEQGSLPLHSMETEELVNFPPIDPSGLVEQ